MRSVTRRAIPSSAAPRRGGLVLSLAVLVFTTVAAAVAPAPRAARAASATTTAALNLRSGPSTADWVILVMPWGSTVNTLGPYQNGFYQVTYGGSTGWAFGTYLNLGASTPAPSPNPGSGTGSATTTAALNLRSGPSTADYAILVMPFGSRVTLTGQSANGFVSVTYNGTAGWAFSSYLTGGGSPSTPAPSPSPQPQTQPSSSPAPTTGTATANVNLNFRSGPGTNYTVLNVIPFGGTVSLTGISQNGFYNVYYGNQRGWAWAQGLNLGGNAPTNPDDGVWTQQEIIDLIYAAADRYGQPRADMLRVARCESNLDPYAVNPAGSYGLFQFVPSTWASTPYASYDIFDPWASANATGWMWANGRRNEWVCQ